MTVPLKPPELKLSVRKLLGCSPSPPLVVQDRSPSPVASPEIKPSPQPVIETGVEGQCQKLHEDTTKGEFIPKKSVFFMCGSNICGSNIYGSNNNGPNIDGSKCSWGKSLWIKYYSSSMYGSNTVGQVFMG